MDVLLLGAAAIVLIALTVWIVWRPSTDTIRAEETTPMMPQGDNFEDQYTSATADLSAGGIAVTTASQPDERLPEPEPAPTMAPPARPVARQPVRPDTDPTLPEVVEAEVAITTWRPEPLERTSAPLPRTAGIGAAAALALTSAAAGAWLYARWQRERNKPLNRLRRRFR